MVTIEVANPRDVTYIAGNLRPLDHLELTCVLPDDTPIAEAGLMCLGTSQYAWTAHDNGYPAVAFGFAPTLNPALWHAWALGTRRFVRCTPALTDFLLTEAMPNLVLDNKRLGRVEARPLKANTKACKWIERLGGVRECDLPRYGKDGQDFVLYAWTDHKMFWTKRESWFNRHTNRDRKDTCVSPL
jgi:hypothetical protein